MTDTTSNSRKGFFGSLDRKARERSKTIGETTNHDELEDVKNSSSSYSDNTSPDVSDEKALENLANEDPSKYKKDKRKNATITGIKRTSKKNDDGSAEKKSHTKSLKKEKKEKKSSTINSKLESERLSISESIATRPRSGSQSVEDLKYVNDVRFTRTPQHWDVEIFFYDDEYNVVAHLRDSEELDMHWENALQKGGGSVHRIDTIRKPKKYLSSIVEVYLNEISQSKIQMMKWIGSNFTRGSKRTYLNFLIEHYIIEIRFHDYIEILKKQEFEISKLAEKINLEENNSTNVDNVKNIKQSRKSQSVASRIGRRSSVTRNPFNVGLISSGEDSKSNLLSQYSSMPHSLKQSITNLQSNINSTLSSNGGSNGGSIGGSSSNYISGSSSNYSSKSNTLKNEEKEHKVEEYEEIYEELIKEERFGEAKECLYYKNTLVQIESLQIEYEALKNEDKLLDAIQVREKINHLKQSINHINETVIDSWSLKPPPTHKTLQQMQEHVIDIVGTKTALPFIEEYHNINLSQIARLDLAEAIKLQNDALHKMMLLAPPLSEEEEKERKRKEEEERWIREAQEKKKKKKMEKTTLKELAQSTSDLLTPRGSIVDSDDLVQILDQHKQ